MAGHSSKSVEPGFLDILEEVFGALRRAPSALAAYYVGSVPFVIALLWFWADTSKSAFAEDRLGQGAAILALTFIWMKTWQAVYTQAVRRAVSDEPAWPWTVRRIARVVLHQLIVQPSGLILLPAALLALVPFPWVYAAYQNATALDDGHDPGVSRLVARSVRLSQVWPKQNSLLIWVLSPCLMVIAAALYVFIIPVMRAISPMWTDMMLSLYSTLFFLVLMPLSPFGMIVGLNVAAAIVSAPMLSHALFGIETPYSQNVSLLFNSTFFAVVCGTVYLCMDPLMKAAYALRVYYGESLRTGDDLRARLRRLAKGSTVVVFALMAAGWAGATASAETGDSAVGVAAARPAAISAEQLDQALDVELHDPVYAWRMPRVEKSKTGPVGRFLTMVSDVIRKTIRAVVRWIDKVMDWIMDRTRSEGPSSSGILPALQGTLRLLVILLVVVLAVALAIVLFRMWQERHKRPLTARAQIAAAKPDVADEATTADQMPEDEWLALARELAGKGELRLALRAVFLATLSHLAQQGLIHIARFKSNMDYRIELERRAHAHPGVVDPFEQSTAVYEAVWYGNHAATNELLECVISNQERLRACVQP